MTRFFELGLFVAAAIAAHIVFFVSTPTSGQDAGGVGGEATLSIAAAAPTVVEMVEDWGRPPETTQQVTFNETPDILASTDLAQLPQFQHPLAPRASVRLNVLETTKLGQADIDTTPATVPAPPKPRKPEEKPEPEKPVQQVKPKPKEQPNPKAQTAKKETAGRAEEKSAGNGGSAHAGKTRQSKTASLSKGQHQELKAVWGSRILRRIEKRKRAVRGLKKDQRAKVWIHVANTGQVLDYGIRKSSGNPRIDDAALNAVRRSGTFPKAPNGFPGTEIKTSFWISFER